LPGKTKPFPNTNSIHHMKKAYVFPGQGAQFPGMGKDLYDQSADVQAMFARANEIVGFDLTKTMFEGTEDELKQTKVTQPAIFLHSVAKAKSLENFHPDMVAGHSLGEFSALVAAGAMNFDDGMSLVLKRALAMQHACELEPSTMAAVLGLADEIVEQICSEITDGIVVAANYNCPGQLVISGSIKGVEAACEKLKAAGAKRALILPVGGAFHSPLMEPARLDLEKAILETTISAPVCPIYQNFTALPSSDVAVIKENLAKQLTGPVRWTQSVQNMVTDGATHFTELGPGKVLQGLVQKIYKEAVIEAAS
jgi:[acyl-carrier-protein] S-malonyltransferase